MKSSIIILLILAACSTNVPNRRVIEASPEEYEVDEKTGKKKKIDPNKQLKADYKTLKKKNKELKEQLRYKERIRKEEDKTLELQLDIKCNSNDKVACHELGHHYLKNNKKYKVRRTWKKNCEKEYLDSCYTLGLSYQKDKSWGNATKFFQAGCSKNHAMSCNNLGYSFYRKRQFKRTGAMFAKACALKLKEGCSNSAKFQETYGTLDKALSARQQACFLGSEIDCNSLQDLEDKKRKKQLSIYSQGCQNGVSVHCFNLGHTYFFLRVKDKASMAFQKACELNDSLSCGYFASLINNESLFSATTKEFAQYCKGGKSQDCFYLAALFAFNNDKVSAVNYLEKALEKGYRSWKHIESAPEFNSIRFSDEFRSLVIKFQGE